MAGQFNLTCVVEFIVSDEALGEAFSMFCMFIDDRSLGRTVRVREENSAVTFITRDHGALFCTT